MSLTATVPNQHRGTASDLDPKPCLRYLRRDEYPVWDRLVDASPQGNVYCRSWWLDALPGDIRILGYFKGDHLVAGIPLYFVRWLGLDVCRLPNLVHTWGVVINPVPGKRATTVSREMDILKVFAANLAKHRIFVHSFHPTLTNWLPFYWNGFEQTTLYSYVLEDLTDVDRLWDEMEGNVRRNIRKAEKSGITVIPCHSDLVVSTARKTFMNQRKKLPYTESYLGGICAAAQDNGAGACFAAVDKQGQPHAAIFIAWDTKRAYFVAGGTDPELRASGAESLLLWHAIKFCADRTDAFDFSGSVVEGIEKFFRSFGGRLVPCNRIVKLPFAARAFRTLMPAR